MAHLLDLLLNAFFDLLPAIAEYMGFKRMQQDVEDTILVARSKHEQKESMKGKILS